MFTYHGPREVVNYKAPLTPPNNIVFVVDESVRCDHLSLNGYERNTTPFLDHIKSEGILYNWGIASSNATSSLNSNTLMLTGINTLPDVNQYSQKKPTIFQYARAMGYKTHYFDMQSDKSWLMASTDLIYVDQRITPKNISIPFAYDDDFEGARLIHKIISQSSGNFIWINKIRKNYFW